MKINNKIILFVPNNLNVIIGISDKLTNNHQIKNNGVSFIYIYNINFTFTILCDSNNFYINNTTSTILFSTNTITSISYINYLQNFIKSLSYYFIKKIKFNGKSYRIEKSNQIINSYFELKFGHAINSYLYVKNLKIQQSKKTKLFFWFINVKKVNKILKSILCLRFWNSYTQRGLRFNKQLIYKRQGKKSSYV